MILLVISILSTLLTGFFISSIFENKNIIKIFICFCLTMFGAIVLNAEILSLFSKISAVNILILNFVFAIISGFIWVKNGKPLYNIKIKRSLKRISYALLKDKYLLVLGMAFIFMCMVSLFLIFTLPVVNPDAEAYHMLRSLFWIGNGNLNHFAIGDIRNLTMPINSEILYMWLLIFTKKQFAFGIVSFTGFLLAVTSLYGIMKHTGTTERERLWVIFILASLPSVIVQISGTETDIIIAGLTLAGMYLYMNHFKDKKTSSLYFSALSFALAIGTKTPALMLIFPVGLWMLWLGYKNFGKEFYKPFIKFFGFGAINFLIFSSYNYILNFIDYGNIFGPKTFILPHANNHGLKGMIAGFIKHIFLFFDFTGFKWNDTLGVHILNLKENILSTINLSDVSDGIYTSKTEGMNRSLLEPLMGMGILGFLVYLPCWIYSLIKPIFVRNKKTIYLFSFGLILLGTILVMSYKIVFMAYSIRFLTAFCVVSAPILVYSYSKKNSVAKFIITLFALFGLLLISTHLWARPFGKIYNYLKHGATISEIREVAKCSLYFNKIPEKHVKLNEMCKVESKIREIAKGKKLLYFGSESENLLLIKMLQFEGYDIDFGLAENANNIDFSKYDMIVNLDDRQLASNVLHPTFAPYYSPVKGVICLYLTTGDNLFLPGYSGAPYRAACEIHPDFYEEHGFELKDTLSTTLRENKDTLKLNYKFYEKK